MSASLSADPHAMHSSREGQQLLHSNRATGCLKILVGVRAQQRIFAQYKANLEREY